MNIDFSKPALEDKLNRITSIPQRFNQGLKNLWQRLTLPQRLYLLAALLLMSEHLGLVAIITTIALTLEFWPLFERIWHSLAGKAVLLLFYAIVANYALAMAGAIVNEVVGVPATHFNYTHNFAILLLLPAWILGISAIGLLFVQLLMPFYLMIALVLKPVGIKLFSLTGNSHYRFTTLMVRFVLSLVLLYHLILLIGDVEERVESALNDLKTIEESVKGESNKGQDKQLTANTDEVAANLEMKAQPSAEVSEKDEALSNAETAQEKRDDQQTRQAESEASLAKEYASLRHAYQGEIRELIAEFAYRLEADSRSRCEKSENANVVELNDYEILEVVPDNTAKYRYRFTVRKCISPAFPAK
ncbi:hypothetical protein K0J45_10240 [Shewanella alkalitolerans]|uniref:hypothetical protein n=1 Tax=Shewanella alkalitolerans TaxID=2864209 RepID=UPI001C65F9B0|nr:hypothetical protein [Shewanella alkalitolerans]QYJ95964.1 hypothetical protein K0J45_10240 [Shewanella alkalitolerans]